LVTPWTWNPRKARKARTRAIGLVRKAYNTSYRSRGRDKDSSGMLGLERRLALEG